MRKIDQAPSLEDLRARREEILRITTFKGARNVRVFGSVARRESEANCDVDLLVEMDPDRTVLDVSELILDLEAALGRRVDAIEARHGSDIAGRILREAVTL